MVAGALLGAAVPVTIGMVLAGIGLGWIGLWVIGGIVVGTLAIWLYEGLRVRASRYRLRGDRIDLRVSLFASSTRSIPLQRIRTVDINADLAQRRLGLATVRLGTGDKDGRFELTSVDADTAQQLRSLILGELASAAGDATTGRLATFSPGWIRYAPVSLGVPLIGLAALGGMVQVADWFNAVPQLWGVVQGVVGEVPLPVQVLLLVVIALLLGAIGSLLYSVEAWWGYRLDRDADGTLHLQRGLIVRRSSTYLGSRIRGVVLHEPIGYRRAGAAKLNVAAVGVQAKSEDGSEKPDSTTIVPPAPRDVAAGVAAAILGFEVPTELTSHPRAATRRRHRWSAIILGCVLAAAVVPAVLWLPQLWWLVGGIAVVGVPVTWWLARDNVRGLGNLVLTDHVVLRSGGVFRSTAVLIRGGVLGWNLRRSPAQRRLGLMTVVATSAAIQGSFRCPDVSGPAAQELVATAGEAWNPLWEAAPPS